MPAAPKTLEDYHAPYPKPTADQKRFVIFLDDKGDDCELDDYKLQLIPGRVMKVDPVNAHVIGGTVKEEEISGWGYNYYVVEMGQAASTLMGVPKDAEYVERFVQMGDTPFIRYNSKLPVVVYMPKDGQLRYRVWKPEEKESIAAVEQ